MNPLSPSDSSALSHANTGSPTGSSPTAVDLTIATNLRTSIQRLVKVLRRHTRNSEMLSLTERSSLGWLYQHERLLPTELAQFEKVTTQSMSQVVSHLFELGLIKKTPSDADKRKTYLSLTDQGRHWIEQARQEKQEWLAQVLHQKTSEKEKEILAAAADILNRLADE